MSDGLPHRIGINAIFLLPGMGGTETYLRELTGELIARAPRTRFSIYCSPQGARLIRSWPWAGEARLRISPLFGLRGAKALIESTLLGAIATQRDDLLHSIAHTGPFRTSATHVVTVHDTTWLTGRAPDPTTYLWRVVIPPTLRHADRLIAVSRQSADDVVRELGVDPGRVDVVLHGHRPTEHAVIPDGEAARARLRLGDAPVVLNVGTRKPHKNVDGLLRAFVQVRERVPRARLVLAGNPTSLEDDLRTEATRLRLDDAVDFLGYVDDQELEELYAAATCLVLPSWREGFGLPILEAMARGLPVACASIGALEEVGRQAVRLFDPGSPDEIATALYELLSDPRRRAELSAAGRARAAQLTWAATAEGTLDSYARALAGTSARR